MSDLEELKAENERLKDKLQHSDRKEIEACYRKMEELEAEKIELVDKWMELLTDRDDRIHSATTENESLQACIEELEVVAQAVVNTIQVTQFVTPLQNMALEALKGRGCCHDNSPECHCCYCRPLERPCACPSCTALKGEG